MTESVHSCLWFETEAQEAAAFYCHIFPNSSIVSSNPIVVIFNLNGVKFMALNGRRSAGFNESVSFVITCENQQEIDHFWNALTDGGEESMCGWLKDKYGVSWQVVPAVLGKLMSDPARAPRVTEAFLKMRKFDIETLLRA